MQALRLKIPFGFDTSRDQRVRFIFSTSFALEGATSCTHLALILLSSFKIQGVEDEGYPKLRLMNWPPVDRHTATNV